jgi:ATP-dependent helicase Lhr and Lhr-like helicase
MATSTLPEPFRRWFATRRWEPRAHQIALLEKARAGRSTLLIAPTGAGKTLAGFLPTLVELAARSARSSVGRGAPASGSGLHTLYVSPLKALAVDVARNLEQPVAEMGLPVRVETRTGDTPPSKRTRQRRYRPTSCSPRPSRSRCCCRPPTRLIYLRRSSALCSMNCTRW